MQKHALTRRSTVVKYTRTEPVIITHKQKTKREKFVRIYHNWVMPEAPQGYIKSKDHDTL